MPRPSKPTERLNLRLPLDLKVRLDLLLVSELEARVPYGDYTNFFSERLREFLEWKTLDLGPYGFPKGYFIRGPKEMVDSLEVQLKRGDPLHGNQGRSVAVHSGV